MPAVTVRAADDQQFPVPHGPQHGPAPMRDGSLRRVLVADAFGSSPRLGRRAAHVHGRICPGQSYTGRPAFVQDA